MRNHWGRVKCEARTRRRRRRRQQKKPSACIDKDLLVLGHAVLFFDKLFEPFQSVIWIPWSKPKTTSGPAVVGMGHTCRTFYTNLLGPQRAWVCFHEAVPFRILRWCYPTLIDLRWYPFIWVYIALWRG